MAVDTFFSRCSVSCAHAAKHMHSLILVTVLFLRHCSLLVLGPSSGPPHTALADMVGYVCKDSGKSHYKTFRKNISKAEANIALTGYRVRQRQLVKDNRVELGKKNFWCILMRFKQVRSVTTLP